MPSSAGTSKIRSSKIQNEDERNETKKLLDLVVEIGDLSEAENQRRKKFNN